MGFSHSPFYATVYYYMSLKLFLGKSRRKGNYFRWDLIKMNFPGSSTFNPSLPWVMKWNEYIENIAAEVVAFVDDLRILGVDEETAWVAGRQLAS